MSSSLNFRLSTGWCTEDKRTGFGDIHETGSAYFGSLEGAEAALARFVAGCDKHSYDRGAWFVHDFAEIEQIDDDGEIVGQPLRGWRSKPAAQEVAS